MELNNAFIRFKRNGVVIRQRCHTQLTGINSENEKQYIIGSVGSEILPENTTGDSLKSFLISYRKKPFLISWKSWLDECLYNEPEFKQEVKTYFDQFVSHPNFPFLLNEEKISKLLFDGFKPILLKDEIRTENFILLEQDTMWK